MKTLTDLDAYLFAEGTHQRAYDKLGGHLTQQGDVAGASFAVWAPNADAVDVIGDFTHWQPGQAPLYPVGNSGVWQGFVSELVAGDRYKYSISPRDGRDRLEKADPFAFAAELRPKTASVVADLDAYRWNDADWLNVRAKADWSSSPISVYEAHLGSWRRDPAQPDRFLSYGELADRLPAYVAGRGYTHIELMPIAEHPLDMSWGYQVTGYFAPTARFGGPADFMYLVDACHAAGLGVVLDWVPAHFPKDAHGLARFDGSHLYEHADPRQGEHPDWGTLIFNYGRHEVRTFLLSNALFWLDRYHIDGLRVDAVASMLYLDYSRQAGEWVPNRFGGRENLDAVDFLRELNGVVHEQFPGALMVAEESTAWPRVTGSVESGGLGFDLKWNMGWMHDTLVYFAHDPVHRRYHQGELTFSLWYAFTEKFVLPLSHDEVVHGKGSLLDKMPGDAWQKLANLRLLYGYMWGHPGKKLLFMGQDFGQWREWDHDQSLDWHLCRGDDEEARRHQGLQRLVTDLNRLYRALPALHEVDFDSEGFEWIDYVDSDNSVIAFRRLNRGGSQTVIFVCNFTPVTRSEYRVGVPFLGRYREVLNTDAKEYGGSGVGNLGTLASDELPWHGQPFSLSATLPPLSVCVLIPDGDSVRPADGEAEAR
ncbi:MAG TPA: 1,4-alpha-glucan branching protein GlgB [Chloroflexota bacterium]|nr:1,4-alpha-glucan branching protein GlgB [Chloroflexota bacterium]